MKNKARSFIISIVMLMAGMTAGFIFLAIAYAGPGWKALIVLLAYLFVSFGHTGLFLVVCYTPLR